MAHDSSKILDQGDDFPRMQLQLVDGEQISLPGDLGGSWGVVLVYRGHW